MPIKKQIMNYFLYILTSIIITSCSVNKKISKDDYLIYNLSLDLQSKSLFHKKESFFYLQKSITYSSFQKRCISNLLTKEKRYQHSDSLCNSGNFPIIDSLGMSMPCILKERFEKFNNVLTNSEKYYFQNYTINDTIHKSINKKLIKCNYAIVIDDKPIKNDKYYGVMFDEKLNKYRNDTIMNYVYFKGPFYSKNEKKAFLESYSTYESNCYLFIKEKNNWKIIGNVNSLP
jgi:hypothetical protein